MAIVPIRTKNTDSECTADNALLIVKSYNTLSLHEHLLIEIQWYDTKFARLL